MIPPGKPREGLRDDHVQTKWLPVARRSTHDRLEQGETKVRTTVCRSLFSKRWILTLAALLLASGPATTDLSGLNAEALAELRAAGVDK
jgi:hypothetical protein